MKFWLLTALLIVSVSAGFAQGTSEKLSFDFDNASFTDIVNAIEKRTNYYFYYRDDDVRGTSLTLHVKDVTISGLLDQLFSGTELHYALDPSGNIFVTKSIQFNNSLADGFFPSDTIYKTKKAKVESRPVFRVTTNNNARGNKVYEIGNKNYYKPGKPVTLSGVIRNNNGGLLSEATIQVDNSGLSVISDNKGAYSITLPSGKYTLMIRYVGMQAQTEDVILYGNGVLDIILQEEVINLDEVVVEAEGEKASKVKSVSIGVEKITMNDIKYVPTVFGEADLLRAILTLPGVKTVGEASTGFNVRGGARDQNLILFNDATIYNPSHFFGLFSAFNPEAVGGVELYKSTMPPRYGGRVSSVLQITGKEGNYEKIKGSAGIGLLTTRLNLEGPIIKDKTTFNIGGRTTYSNWMFKVLPEDSELKDNEAEFYDVNVSLRHEINAANSLSLIGYLSHDNSNLNTDTLFSYNNANISLRWEHQFGDRLSASVSVGQDQYDYNNTYSADTLQAYTLDFRIRQQMARLNFVYNPSNLKHKLEFGVHSIHYNISPGTLAKNHPSSLVTPVAIQNENALETALYLEDDFRISDKVSLNGGIRYTLYNYLGPKMVRIYNDNSPRTADNAIDTISYGKGSNIKTYHGLDGRVSVRYAITPDFSIKAGYTTTRQFIHMLSNTVAISPTDVWKLSDTNIKPQLSQQYSVGIYKNLKGKNSEYEISVEGYIKRIDNYLDYKSGARLFVNDHIETEVFTTEGKAYGIETMIRKPRGKFNGWMSYTYSRTLLRVNDPIAGETINKGNYYPANYDKPHDFTFVGNQKFTRRFSISLNVTYSTGRPITIPVGVFYYGNQQKTLYSDRNSYRIPDYFRADLSINIEGNHKIKQLTHSYWTIGAYNITGRKNPYSIYFTAQNGTIQGYKLSIFGSIIPFVNYNIRF